jgi:type IV pilus assembly protein PilO
MGMKVLLRIGVCILIIAGGLAAFYFTWAQPVMKHDAELAQEIEDRQRALADLDRSTAGIDDINRKIKELQDAVQFFESKLPQQKEVETILAQVWKMAEANALQAKTIKSGKTERTANYSEQTIEMSLAGDFTGFYLFMQQLEKLPRLMRITDMTLTKISEHDGQMQATLTLNIFFEPDDTGGNATARSM